MATKLADSRPVKKPAKRILIPSVGSLDEYIYQQAAQSAAGKGSMSPYEVRWAASRMRIRERIQALVESIVESVSQGRLPSLIISRDSWISVNVNTGVLRSDNSYARGCDLGTVNKVERFARLLVVLKIVYGLLMRDEKSTVRQIFYDNVELFETQVNVNVAVNDITKLLECTRRDLNVVSTAKGLVNGDLQWQLMGCDDWIDCRAGPTLIPNDLRGIQKMETGANIVLIVEKDAIFQKLIDQDAVAFLERHELHVLLLTGKGVPDLCTRQLLHVFSAFSTAKLFLLTDADAYGIEIAGIYSFGSLAQAYTENYGIPEIKWIGLLPSEIELYQMDPESRIVSSAAHENRLRNLLTRPWMRFRKEWLDEVSKLIALKCRAEIEALDQFGQTFLLKRYILDKLLDGTE